jgi:2-dehydropantoate 2-reductase
VNDYLKTETSLHSPSTRIGIFGAGAIGCYLGGLLASQGCDVTFLGRERLQKNINTHGLTLTHFARGKVRIPSEGISISLSPNLLKPCDVILLCTKSQDTKKAALQLREFVAKDTHIISCQNGLSNVPDLRAILGDRVETLSGAIVPFNVTETGPGTYHCGTEGALRVEHDIPQDVLDAFTAAGQSVICGGNFEGDQWAKLLVNLNNALNTLSGGTLRDGLLQRPYRLALADMIKEGLAVAEANSINVGNFNGRKPRILLKILYLPNWAYRLVMQLIVKIDAKARSSMLDDLESGRVSEIDFIQGEIVAQAKAAGLTAPMNEIIYKAVKTAFQNGKSPRLSGQDIYDLIKK